VTAFCEHRRCDEIAAAVRFIERQVPLLHCMIRNGIGRRSDAEKSHPENFNPGFIGQ
jgi:hypothetical protein